jgi:GMP synthase-like glutamine amidotransferase
MNLSQDPAKSVCASPDARVHRGEGLNLYELPRFLDPTECAWLIACIDRQRAPSPIFLNKPDPDPEFRTSETCWMDHSDPRVTALYDRISRFFGLDVAHAEAMQGQRYAPGQRFKPHYDYFDTSKPYWEEEKRRGGQRSWTAMLFLDEPEGGGETNFPLAGVTIAPQAGTLLAWDNMDSTGQPNPQTLHEGRPVEGGGEAHRHPLVSRAPVPAARPRSGCEARRVSAVASAAGLAEAAAMNLAILETGKPPEALIPRFGRYPAMLERLLELESTSYDVAVGEFPKDPAAHEAYLITGSPAGVYDDLPWIEPLAAFLRSAKGRAKLVGICFGHQIMAEAFGGHVEKSDKGWGVGLHNYPVVRREPWMDEASIVSVPASHQDQVVLQPPNTEVLASSVFTPYAALAWRDQPAISFQFHPEFPPGFAEALIESRRDRIVDADRAIASLARPNDTARVGGWIRRFLLS